MRKIFFIFPISILFFLGGMIVINKLDPIRQIPHEVKISNIPMLASSGAVEFFQKAKAQIGVVTSYDTSNRYYGEGGFPPPDTGVCSDVIWRAYNAMGYDFKSLLQENMKVSSVEYKNPGDTNIAFRRVKNLFLYFSNTAKSLTLDMLPGDTQNLSEWQVGDIVIFDELPSNHLWHIGIIADIRNKQGVPYMIDNHGKGVNISITPLDWPTKIIGHFRPF